MWPQPGRGEVQELERGLATTCLMANDHQIYFETQWGADNMFGHQPLFFPSEAQSPLGPLYGTWYSSAGARGKTPPPRMRALMDTYRKTFGVPDQERTKLAKEVWKIALDELWIIPVVSNSPASQGVRVIKTTHIAHTETWYFKTPS